MNYHPSTPARPILAAVAVALSSAWLLGMTVLPAAAGSSVESVAFGHDRNGSAVVGADGHVRVASVTVTIY